MFEDPSLAMSTYKSAGVAQPASVVRIAAVRSFDNERPFDAAGVSVGPQHLVGFSTLIPR